MGSFGLNLIVYKLGSNAKISGWTNSLSSSPWRYGEDTKWVSSTWSSWVETGSYNSGTILSD